MKKSLLLGAVYIFLLISSGCSMNAKLYPVNDIAQPTGLLEAKYFPVSAGSANVTIEMPDGEILEGQFTLIEGPTANFGSILAAEGNASAVGVSGGTTSGGKFPGVGTLIGDRGTRMDCEFNRSSFGGGVGACLTTTGALYRLHMPR
jgi:hypothetical protein